MPMAPLLVGSIHSGRSKHSANSSSRGYDCTKCDRKTFKRSKAVGEPKYCERHQCGIVDSEGFLCRKPKERKDSYCGRHLCKTLDCQEQRIPDEPDNVYSHCLNHTCVFEGCLKEIDQAYRANANLELCNTHSRELCATAECYQRRIDTGCYCLKHNCRIAGCHSEVVNASRPFCSRHNVCGNEECKKEKGKVGSRFQNVCEDHLQCGTELCSRKSSPGSPYCILHSCKYQSCLNKARPDIGKPFCREHKCEGSDCRSLKSHIEVKVGGDSQLDLHKFCDLHKCKVKGCTDESNPQKGYCNRHHCIELGCMQKGERNQRCSTHHDEKIAKDTEKRVSAEYEAKKAQAQARQREKENTTPPREHSTTASSNTGQWGGSQRWRNNNSYDPGFGNYGRYDKFWNERSGL